MWRVLSLTTVLALAGCGSRPPVPVVEGRAPVVVEAGRGSGAAAPARAGYYVVKKGDNLYRIALAHGATTHDLVTWNNLSDETRVEVGQELRVTPPEGVVEVKPIEAPAPIVVVGDGASPAGRSPVTAGAAGGVVREPKGGKVAYSDTALAQARAMDGMQSPKPAEHAAPVPTPAAPAPAPAAAPSPAPAAPAATDGIDWTWPVAGSVMRGFVEGGNGKEANRGIDLAGRKGEPIHAAAAGKVSFVGTLRGYGDFLVVRHNADYISVYAHTSKILVKRDQSVTKGQKIAEVGSSDADQAKLHFEIRHKSEPVDPVKLLPPR